MANAEKLMTELRYEGGKTISLFESHPPIDVVGMSKVSQIPEAWSAPHLFVASVESCFLLTMLAIAEKMHIGIRSYASTAEGVLVSADGKHHVIGEIIIRPNFHLVNEADRLRLKLLAQKAEEYCLVANSLKTKVTVEM
jgi:organic hydroperoxide reductase OsmC/OhrA